MSWRRARSNAIPAIPTPRSHELLSGAAVDTELFRLWLVGERPKGLPSRCRCNPEIGLICAMRRTRISGRSVSCHSTIQFSDMEVLKCETL